MLYPSITLLPPPPLPSIHPPHASGEAASASVLPQGADQGEGQQAPPPPAPLQQGQQQGQALEQEQQLVQQLVLPILRMPLPSAPQLSTVESGLAFESDHKVSQVSSSQP